MEGSLSQEGLIPGGASYGGPDLQGSFKVHNQAQHHHLQTHQGSSVNPSIQEGFLLLQNCDHTMSLVDYSKGDRCKNSQSDDEPSFNEDGIEGKKGSMWHRVKWTDKMVKLLITAVSYIGDDIASDYEGGGRRKFQIIQKKGKWKLMSKVMAERGYQVSPQQCEDKFNDLNKRYKRLNDMIGRGTTCQVVENPALLDVIDYLTDKEKDDVRKILNSKQLFYEEMCSYHNLNRLHLPHDPALQRSLQLACRVRDDHDYDEPRRHQNDDFDENEHGETDEHDDFEENFAPYGDDTLSLGGSVKRLRRGQDFDDAHACGNSLNSLDCNRGSHAYSQTQFAQGDIYHLETESMKGSSSQKQWMELRLLQLEDQKLQTRVEMLELEKQKFKWERVNKKKDRELEKMRMINERMKLENERVALDIKQKEIGSRIH
ncbi:uncharacterized protein LOC111487246 [Cucurbita maxima]|uniref:Uncharacterized protein LOC111487246 n=1 Tax=Cucurbita maxima TaxID=3661 RepID=A0A6J1JT31_CUCMA|nr:uncharacterized protein LOC111487246 [Cucurbita maxima]